MVTGSFIVCASHTGNLLDVPARTLDKIKNTKYIFCEFLYEFNRTFVEFYKIDMSGKIIVDTGGNHDQEKIASDIIKILMSGEDVVFITDSGLIGFADNGVSIVHLMYMSGINVELIPGPTIVSSAIAIAGIPASARDVIFTSFFDYDIEEKKKKLSQIKNIDATIVILDFPYKIKELIVAIKESIGDERFAALCVNIGMDSQLITRKRIKNFLDEDLELDDYCYTTLVLEGVTPYFSDANGNSTLL